MVLRHLGMRGPHNSLRQATKAGRHAAFCSSNLRHATAVAEGWDAATQRAPHTSRDEEAMELAPERGETKKRRAGRMGCTHFSQNADDDEPSGGTASVSTAMLQHG